MKVKVKSESGNDNSMNPMGHTSGGGGSTKESKDSSSSSSFPSSSALSGVDENHTPHPSSEIGDSSSVLNLAGKAAVKAATTVRGFS